MKISALKKYTILASLIFLAGFNAIVFIVKKENFTNTFWVAYAFIHFAFLTTILVALFSKDGKNGEAYIYPAITVCTLYAAVMFIVGLIIMIFPKIPVTIALVVLLVFTILAAIVFAFSLINKAILVRENAPKPMMFNMNDVANVLMNIQAQANDAALKDQIVELAEMARLCDPNANEKYKELDKLIFNYVQFLEKNVRRNEMKNVFNNVSKIKELLKERNA